MLDRLLSGTEQAQLQSQVRAAYPGGVLTSLHGSSASLAAALLFKDRPAQTLVVAASLDEAEGLTADLATWLPDTPVLLFPEQEILPYDKKSPYKGLVGQQVEVLHRLLDGEPCVVVTSATGLKWKVLPAQEIRSHTLHVSTGTDLDLEAALRCLGEMGYYAVPRVETPGDFARKGGILDIFSVAYENPVRIELVGDTIESIRFFDATTQRSQRETDAALVPPCSPLILAEENVRRAVAAVRDARHGSPAQRERLVEHIGERLHFDGMERYAAYYSRRALLTDYLHPDARIVWVSPQAIVDNCRRLDADVARLFAECVTAGEPVPPPQEIYASSEDLITLGDLLPTLLSHRRPAGRGMPRRSWRCASPGRLPRATGRRRAPAGPPHDLPEELLEDFGEWEDVPAEPQEAPARRACRGRPCRSLHRRRPPSRIPDTIPPRVVRCAVQAAAPYAGNVPELQRDLARRLRAGQRIHIFCDNEGQAERLREILDEVADDLDFPVGELQTGFVLPTLGEGVIVLTDREIFQRYRKRVRRRKYRVSQGASAYEELQPGDFVVHVNYGVARYLGIKTIQIEQSEMDCLELLFADGDKIFVTVDQINMVEKYVGKEGVAPPLTKLGGTAWTRTKAKAKAAIEEMARELLEMAAIRAARQGHAFGADSHLLRELEASFIYEETPDQLTAIQDVKRDMEREQPMDRLVCGDVGYGKTEVAIRAAFKAVLDSKQVAVLVPTTILAQQHLTTFRERCADFPVQVEMLSRLRSPKEAKAILAKVAAGEIDVVIGTHRLLSKDVQFKSLGLIVIDEEHRFGVAHKEKLKQLKQTVDVLSMTATPIPRTLNMALIGLRDMSLIETPPRDRLPVQTEILPFDEETIVDAIRREAGPRRAGLLRAQPGGEHRRHGGLRAAGGAPGARRRGTRADGRARTRARHARFPGPQARHPGLDHDHRERARHSERQHDRSSTAPTAWDWRSSTSCAAGSGARRTKPTPTSWCREVAPRPTWRASGWQCCRSSRTLGSGFKIAMRDLEIRGAGNILGQQQHGHLVAIGFELYCKLLEQTIAELQGREVPEDIATKVEVDADYLIPDDYVPDPEEKMRVYKKIAALTEAAGLAPLREELVDRYGPPPPAAETLLQVAALRLLAWRGGIDRVRVRAGKAEMWLREGRTLARADIETLVRTSPNKLAFDAASGFKIIQHFKAGDRLQQVAALLETLEASVLESAGPATRA